MRHFFTFISLLFWGTILVAQPSNDDCTNAIDLGQVPFCPNPSIYTNVDATTSFIGADNIPSCFNGGTVQRDVWFQFTIPADGSIVDFTITVTGVGTSIQNPQVALYRGDCEIDGLAELQCVSAGLGQTEATMDVFGLTPGVTYFLRINDYSASAQPNSGEFQICVAQYIPDINIGDVPGTGSCTGTLYDSGGPDATYSNSENHTFTICPDQFHQCIFLNVENYNMENGFDFVRFFGGPDINSPLLATLTGSGSGFEVQAFSDCITIQFTSDGSVVQNGFTITWECSADTCTIPPPTSCAEPANIGTLPYSADDLSTCFSGNSITGSPCNNDAFLAGNDYVFAYNSPGDECITVGITGANTATGVALFDGCPNNPTTLCIDQAGGGFNQFDPTIDGAFLETAGTYYIVVANGGNCTPFNISVDTVSCPIVLPSAAHCEDALNIGGCSNDVPNILALQPGAGDPNFINDLNRGCILNPQLNYTFFYFQAGADGNFGFTMHSADPAEASDIDFSVWGPVDSLPGACQYIMTHQPQRSSWAAGADPTGLADIHPVLGTPVLDTWDCGGTPGAGGDDFVSTLPVQQGKYYFIWIDDFGQAIQHGGISIDFGATTDGVLDPMGELFHVSEDTVLCQGESTQLLADGGEVYNWYPSTGLSCTHCPNPIATPDETTTYQVDISGACNTYTDYVTVGVYDVKAGPDLSVCVGETIQIFAGSNFAQAQWSWQPTTGLSCTDCPNPVVTALAPGDIEYHVTLITPNCTLTDTMVLTILPGNAPTYQIANNATICEGQSINIGGLQTPGVNYAWTSNPGSFASSLPNPNVAPSETTKYYLVVTNSSCPLPSLDSVLITVNTIPVINLANDTLVCQGESVLLGNTSPEPGITYNWTPAGSLDMSNIANPLATPSQTTNYILTSVNGVCTLVDTVHVGVVTISVDITNPDTLRICQGTQVQLNANAQPLGTPVHWTASDGSINSTQVSITVIPQTTTTYFADVSVPGCNKTASVYIIVDSLPYQLDVYPADTTVCSGSLVLLTTPTYEPANFPDVRFQWSPLSGLQSSDTLFNLVLQPTESLNYVRTTTNGVCISKDSSKITVIPVADISVTPANPEICAGQSVSLTASSTPPLDSLKWSPQDGLNCTNCFTVLASPNNTTTYNITGDFMGCPSTASVTVTVIPAPAYNFPFDQSLCPGESALLNSGPYPPNYTYQWTATGYSSTQGDPTVSPTQTTTYHLSISNGACSREDSVTIVVNNGALSVSNDTTICVGNQALLTANGNLPGTYTWSTGQTGSPIAVNPDQNTTYSVDYQYGDGCHLSGEVLVNVLQNFNISYSLTPDTTSFYQGDTLGINITTSGAITNPTYLWTLNGDTLDNTAASGAFVLLNNPSTFWIAVTSQEGCVNSVIIGPLEVVPPSWELPTAFTPNNDSKNDKLNVFFRENGNVVVTSFQVFSRWGQKVFDDPNGGWDGTYNGKELPSDVYIAVVKLKLPTGKEVVLARDITLVR